MDSGVHGSEFARARVGRDVPPHPAPVSPANQPRIDLRWFPPGTTFLRVLGVDYVHLSMGDRGDLYLTNYGAPFYQHLLPENWHEQPWFGD